MIFKGVGPSVRRRGEVDVTDVLVAPIERASSSAGGGTSGRALLVLEKQDPNDEYVVGSGNAYTLEMALRSWRLRRFAEWQRDS
jgi:hypothetical protein